MQNKIDEVEDLLDKLGDTKGKIAETMRRQGIKGRMFSLCACPVAKYFRKNLSCRAYVDHEMITIRMINEDNKLDFGVPPVVKEFINDFDNNLFPDLVEAYNDNG